MKIILWFFIGVFLFFSSVFYGIQSTKKETSPPVVPSSEKHSDVNYLRDELFTETPSSSNLSYQYKIKSDHQYISLFELQPDGREILLKKYEANITSLREADISLLEKGIILASQTEAEETLENFMN